MDKRLYEYAWVDTFLVTEDEMSELAGVRREEMAGRLKWARLVLIWMVYVNTYTLRRLNSDFYIAFRGVLHYVGLPHGAVDFAWQLPQVVAPRHLRMQLPR